MVSGVLLARMLGAEGYGNYVYVMSIITVLGIPIQSGLHTLIVRETAYYNAQKQWALMKGLLNLSTHWVYLSSTIILIASLVLVYLDIIDTQLSALSIGLALILLPITQINLLRSAMLRGLTKVSLSEVPEQIIKPICVISALALLLYFNIELNLDHAFGIVLMGSVIAFSISYTFVHSQSPTQLKNTVGSLDIERWKKSWLPLALFSWVHIANSQINVLLLGALADKTSVGLFQVGFQAASVVAIALAVINSVTAPHIATLNAEKRISAIQTLLTRSAQLATISATLVLAVYCFWGEALITFIFGEEFRVSWKCMLILSLGHLASAFAGSVGITLQMLGYDKSTTQLMCVGFAVNLLISIILIPLYGAEGAAVAYAGSIVLWNTLLAFKLKSATTLNSTIFRVVMRKPS